MAGPHEIALLEEKIKEAMRQYDMFFLGVQKQEPLKLREEIKQIILRMHADYIPTTTLKFKFKALVDRFNIYQQYWDRVLREREEGRSKRFYERYEVPEQPSSKKKVVLLEREKDGSFKEESLWKVYSSFIELKNLLNEPVDNISFEKLSRSVEKKASELINKFRCSSVEAKILEEDKKVKIKLIPKP